MRKGLIGSVFYLIVAIFMVGCSGPGSSGTGRDDSSFSENVPKASTSTLKTELNTSSTITFISDTTWAASGPTGTSLGSAQAVCLNASAPSNCPAGATLYSYGNGWIADLSSIPGAVWIWALGVTAATSPAYPAEFLFSKTFNLTGNPVAGFISIAADDFAEVFVNSTSVGMIGSETNYSLAGEAQSSLTTFDITSFLVAGDNVVSVRAANGLFDCGTTRYGCNPAGVVFGGSFQLSSVGEILIDIKPDGLPNSINPRCKGVIPVAILTTGSFDASTVDPTTVRFGASGTEAAPSHSALEDVDGDGDTDMILHFDTLSANIKCGDTSASLTGKTFGAQIIKGSDSISTVGCK